MTKPNGHAGRRRRTDVDESDEARERDDSCAASREGDLITRKLQALFRTYQDAPQAPGLRALLLRLRAGSGNGGNNGGEDR